MRPPAVPAYRIIRPLASPVEGPETLLARLQGGRVAVVKRSRGPEPGADFRLLRGVDHPGIPGVLACGVEGGQFWHAVEPFRGEVLEDGWPEEADPLRFATAAVQTLLYLDACGAFHGDVHPGNLVVRVGGFDCGLIDFDLSDPGISAPCGRPGFVAPEVLKGGPRGLAADLYGLGMSLRRRITQLPSPLDALSTRLLSEDPESRIRSAESFVVPFPRPLCRARLEGREEACGAIQSLFLRPADPVATLLLHGASGSGKTALLRWAELEAQARGWRVTPWTVEEGRRAAGFWRRSARPLLVLADLDGSPEDAGELAAAVDAAAATVETGIRVLAACRTAVSGPWTPVELGPVPAAIAARLYSQCQGIRNLDGLDTADLARRTGNLPGAVSLAAVADRAAGLLRFSAGRWELTPEPSVAVPAEPAALAARRLASLRPDELRLLAACAAARGYVPVGDLLAAVGADAAALQNLLSLGLARPAGECLVPAEDTLGSVALGSLPELESRRLHDALARNPTLPADLAAESLLRGTDPGVAVDTTVAVMQTLQRQGRLARRRVLLDAARRVCPDGHPRRPLLDLLQIEDDARRRRSPEIAAAALHLARKQIPEGLRRAAFTRGVQTLVHLADWERLEAVFRQEWPLDRAWIADRAAFVRAFRDLTPDAMAAIREIRSRTPEPFSSAAEARLVGWLAAVEGRAREAVRAELAAARLARQAGDWGQWGTAIATAMPRLVDLGMTGRAARLAGLARRSLNTGLRAHDLAQVLKAEADLEAARGAVHRSLGRSDDWLSLVTSMGAPPEVRNEGQPVRIAMRRHVAPPDEVLAELDALRATMDELHRRWSASVRIALLEDLGRPEDALAEADRTAASYRAEANPVGECWMHTLAAQVNLGMGDAGRAASRLAAADALPARDSILQGTRLGVRGLLDIHQGRADRGATGLLRALALLRTRATRAREFAARGAIALAAAGDRKRAAALLDLAPACPDSALLAVLEAVALASCEPSAVGALRRLRTVEPLLHRVGPVLARSWQAAAAAAAGRSGQDALVEQLAASPPVPPPAPVPPETTPLETRNLAAEARRIHDIVRDMNAELDLPRLLDRVLETALSVSGAERGFIVLGTGSGATVRASRQLPGGIPPAEETFSRSVADQVLQTGTPFLSRDATLDDRLEGAASVQRLQVRSVLSMPFRLHGRLLGVFYLDHRSRSDAFDPAAIDLLQTFADLAAVAIENARLFEENQRARQVLEREARTLREELEEVKKGQDEGAGAALKHPYATIAGRGAATCRMLRQLDRACGMTLPVLIVGETGTGKELVARALHMYGARARGSFEVENCAAISPELMESELFGHVKGAFSGAISDHEGLFRRADGGTVFLDEIGELSLPLQAKLLRVIEDGMVRPVGSDKAKKVHVRVVAATHRDLEALSRTGAFRQDLYFRLASLVLRVPALAERVEDIPVLVKRFLSRHDEMGIEPGALKLLMKAPWPGNIRQLQNFVEVLAAVSSGTVKEKDVRDLMDRKNPDAPGVPLADSLPVAVDRYRREQVLRALTDSGGDITAAARDLGISYQAMRKLVLKYDFSALRDGAPGTKDVRPGRRGRWPRR